MDIRSSIVLYRGIVTTNAIVTTIAKYIGTGTGTIGSAVTIVLLLNLILLVADTRRCGYS